MMSLRAIPTPTKRLGLTHPAGDPTSQRPRRVRQPDHLHQQILGLTSTHRHRVDRRDPLPKTPHQRRRVHDPSVPKGCDTQRSVVARSAECVSRRCSWTWAACGSKTAISPSARPGRQLVAPPAPRCGPPTSRRWGRARRAVSLRPQRKIGVITNAGPSARRALYAKFPFADLIDLMVVSAEEGIAKPQAGIYLSACERLEVEPTACVFLDDKPANVDGAKAVGMHAIHFRSPRQAVDDLRSLLD
jgi:hypothetical protein